jgi:hypothetical protein
MADNDHSMHLHLDAPTPVTDSTSATPSIVRCESVTAAIEKGGFLPSAQALPPNDVPTPAPTNAKSPTPADGHHRIKSNPQPGPAANALIDLSETHIATLLSQFKQLVTLCIAPEEDAATLETQAARSLQIEIEWQTLARLHCNGI